MKTLDRQAIKLSLSIIVAVILLLVLLTSLNILRPETEAAADSGIIVEPISYGSGVYYFHCIGGETFARSFAAFRNKNPGLLFVDWMPDMAEISGELRIQGYTILMK